MADDDRDAPCDRFDARALFACLDALGHATIALTRAESTLIAATGNSMHGATVFILRQAAQGLLNELGAQFAAMRASENLDTRAFVEDVLAHLHAPDPERATVPPEPPPA